MDKLTPTLNDAQIKQNIDSLQSQGVSNDKIQAYVNNYSRDATGNYVLKLQNTASNLPTVSSPGAVLSRVASAYGLGDIKNKAEALLPAAGATLGAIGGGLLGGLISSPSVLGIPLGVTAGATLGSASGGALGEAAKEKLQGQALSPRDIATSGGVYGAMEAVGGPLFSLAGKAVEATGAGIAKMFIPKTEAEAGMLQVYKASTSFIDRIGSFLKGDLKAPATAATAAFDRGLVGTESMLGVGAKRAQTKIWDTLIGPALKQSTDKADMPSFFSEAETRIIKETNDPTRQKVLLNALSSIKEDFGNMGKISLEQLQKFKEGWAEFVPEKVYKGESIVGAVNDVRSTLAGMARSKIYDSLGENIRQAYIDYGNLNSIRKLGVKAMTGVVKGGTGTSLKNIWEMLTVPVGTIGGQTIYKIGQVFEIIGKPGARILRNALIPSTSSVLPQTQGPSSPSGSTQQASTPATPPQTQ